MRNLFLMVILGVLVGCAEIIPEPFEPSAGHINAEAPVSTTNIPELVQEVPMVPEPEPPMQLEKYTVVVNEVPVNELLFALARDAEINVDIDPTIEGIVTINAVDQTLPQLLDRITRQVNLRYEIQGDNLMIVPDAPFFRTYNINYLNVARETSTSITTDTGIGESSSGGGGGGNNSSSTEVTSESTNFFWSNLTRNVSAILGESSGSGGTQTEVQVTNNVIPLPESGLLTVNATETQHELIQMVIDDAMENAERQVLIQATIVEVTLDDDFQAGVDWSFLNQGDKAGFNVQSTANTGTPNNTLSSFVLSYVDPNTARDQLLTASVQLLEEFGDVNVLSSPQMMVLNNQTSILKVVDNIVYFEVDVEPAPASIAGTVGVPAVDTTAMTVPVGVVMSITPQINENDSIILQVRPTISRILSFVNDPNPELARQNVENPVPQIQIREMESILRLNNGQIGVLGGLMQDEERSLDAATPGISKIPFFGEVFKSRQREFSKTELVIFLRPVVIRTPSIDSDLNMFRRYLEQNTSATPAGGVN